MLLPSAIAERSNARVQLHPHTPNTHPTEPSQHLTTQRRCKHKHVFLNTAAFVHCGRPTTFNESHETIHPPLRDWHPRTFWRLKKVINMCRASWVGNGSLRKLHGSQVPTSCKSISHRNTYRQQGCMWRPLLRQMRARPIELTSCGFVSWQSEETKQTNHYAYGGLYSQHCTHTYILYIYIYELRTWLTPCA